VEFLLYNAIGACTSADYAQKYTSRSLMFLFVLIPVYGLMNLKEINAIAFPHNFCSFHRPIVAI